MAPPNEPPSSPDAPLYVQIRVGGQLAPDWADWFGDVTITIQAGDGETLLQLALTDQAALFAVLRKVRDLGLPLLAVNRIDPPGPTDVSS